MYLILVDIVNEKGLLLKIEYQVTAGVLTFLFLLSNNFYFQKTLISSEWRHRKRQSS